MSVLEQVKFDDQGLIPAIAQDYKTSEILMFALMNKEALSLTIENNRLCTILVLGKNSGLRVKSLAIPK